MVKPRRPGTRVVTILIPLALLGSIPAGMLRSLPLVGTVQDLLDCLFTEVVKDGIRIYEQKQRG